MTTKGTAFLFFAVLGADQLTKNYAIQHLALGESVEVVPELFNFTLVYNAGAAFGMFSGLPDIYRWSALGVVSLLALLVVFRFMLKEARGDRASELALSAILAGAVGNIIDRFRFDAVVDFLDFYWGDNHWPAFNIADSAISLGVAVLIIRMLFESQPEGPAAEA